MTHTSECTFWTCDLGINNKIVIENIILLTQWWLSRTQCLNINYMSLMDSLRWSNHYSSVYRPWVEGVNDPYIKFASSPLWNNCFVTHRECHVSHWTWWWNLFRWIIHRFHTFLIRHMSWHLAYKKVCWNSWKSNKGHHPGGHCWNYCPGMLSLSEIIATHLKITNP